MTFLSSKPGGRLKGFLPKPSPHGRLLTFSGLLLLAQGAWAGTTAVPSFAPGSFPVLGSSTLTITLSNDASNAVLVTPGAALSLPSGLTFASTPSPSTTCTGLGVNASGSTLTFSGTGTIPAASGPTLGTCAITATVTSSVVNPYSFTLPAGYFSTSDGGHPPGNALTASVTATAPAAVSVALHSTRGSATTPWPVPVVNSLFTPHAVDFTPALQTRFRVLFTNSNPIALTNVSFNFPDFSPLAIIPNSLIPGSVVTDGSTGGLTSGAVACGGTLAVAPYTVTPPTPTGSITGLSPTPATLSGATIPANGTCEVSFLVRWDIAPVANGVPTLGSGGNTLISSYNFAAGSLTSAEGITNSPATGLPNVPPQQRTFAGYMRTAFPNGVATSGFAGDSTTVSLTFSSSGEISPMTPTGAGLLWQVDAGVEPVIPAAGLSSTNGNAGNCPKLPPSAWNASTRQISFTSTFLGNTCTYAVPFTSSYAGPDAYVDAQVCALPNGPNGIAGDADDAYVTTAGGLQIKVPGYWGPLNSQNCVAYRAVKGAANPNAVQVGFELLDYAGNVVRNIRNGGNGMVQLTLTAPAGVSNYSLTTNPSFSQNFLKNADSALSYVPAAATTCTGALSAPVNQSYFSIDGVNLAAGQSCTINVPVVYFANSGMMQFSIQTCDAIGTVAGTANVCSAGINPPNTSSGQNWTYTQSFTPAVADMASAPAQGTIYQFVLTKPEGLEPVEKAAFRLNLAGVSGIDYGLQATEIVTNTCNATIDTVSGGPGTALPNLTAFSVSNISTPESQMQAGAVYNSGATGQFDPNAFKASTCTIALKLVPTTNLGMAGSETITGITSTTIYSSNGGNTLVGAINSPVSPSYARQGGPFSPLAISTSFSPSTILAGDTSTLTIILDNSTGNTIDLTNAALPNTYPAGLFNASPAGAALTTLSGKTCTGTVTAADNGGSVALGNGYIPAGSKCAITVNVTTTNAGGVTNTIAGGTFGSDQHLGDSGATSASLVLSASIGPVLQFAPAALNYDPNDAAKNVGTLQLSIVNSFHSEAGGMAFTQLLPDGMTVNGAITASGVGCSLPLTGGSVGSTGFSVSGGAVPADSTCALSIPVKVGAPGAYVASLASGALSSSVGSNTSNASATLTAAAPATVSVAKQISGPAAGAPAVGYGMTLTCANSGGSPFMLNPTISTPATQLVQANDTCSVAETTVPTEEPGYQWSAPVAVSPSGDFSTASGGTTSVTVTNTVEAAAQAIKVAGSVFDPAAGGTAPQVSLTCGAAAVGGSYPNFTAPTGASCTLSAGGGTAPTGYTAGTTTFTATGSILSGNTFTVAAGTTTITATTPLVAQSQAINVTSSVFSPALGGTAPQVSLTCSAAAVGGSYPNFTAPTGASCTLNASGGTAPEGYTVGTTTFAVSGASNGSTTFTVGAGTTMVAATTQLVGKAQTATVTANAFSAAGAQPTGGTLPTVTLSCGAATASGDKPSLANVPTGTSCTVSAAGATAPAGYTLGEISFGGKGVNAGSGAFTMPSDGVGDITVTTALKGESQNVRIGGAQFMWSNAPLIGGRLPDVTLDCGSSLVITVPPGSTSNTLGVPTGTNCTLGTAGAVAPEGYELAPPDEFVVTYQGKSLAMHAKSALALRDDPVATNDGNQFVVPAGDTSITVRVPVRSLAQPVQVPLLDARSLALLALLLGGAGMLVARRKGARR